MIFFTVVVIGMEETVVTVSEGVGQRELCASISSGELTRDAEVTVTFIDESAIGECVLMQKNEVLVSPWPWLNYLRSICPMDCLSSVIILQLALQMVRTTTLTPSH